MTNGKEIWEQIKDKDIDVFALKAKVSEYFEFMNIDPAQCYLLTKASAALPALEMALGSDYTCELINQYILVKGK